MKLDPTIKKETGFIVAGETILVALMLAGFFVLRRFSLPVVFGALLGGLTAVGNFFLMGLTVQKAVDKPPEDRARLVRVSQSLRLLAVGAIAALAIAVFKFDIWATLIPLFFPRIIVTVRGLMLKDNER